MQFKVSISPGKIAQILSFGALLFVLLHSAGNFLRYVLNYTRHLRVMPLFNLDAEQSIPTWYASSMLLICAMLLGAIAFLRKKASQRDARHWGILSVIFLYLSIDEAASIHEMFTEPLRSTIDGKGLLYFTWVIAGGGFVLIVAIAYWRFLAALPATTRNLFIIAGAIYIGGTLGMELIGGYQAELYGKYNFAYALTAALEEFMEMMGIITFIYALLSYLNKYCLKQVLVFIEDKTPQQQLIHH